MSENICLHINCEKSKRQNPSLKMFRFTRDHRLEVWIFHSGK